jgi:hypothetical protein
MRNVGKVTVQLLDGKGYGPRIAEIGNWVGKAFFAPRADLAQLLRDRDEDCSKPGVYCLKFIDPTNGSEMVYIGEADCLSDRLIQHLRSHNKGNFVEVMFFMSYNDWLTKTQVKYLEHRLVYEANLIGARILNGNAPSQPFIQGSERNDLEDFLDCMMLLLPVMGFRFMLKEFIPIVEEFEMPDPEEDLVDEGEESIMIVSEPEVKIKPGRKATTKIAAEKTGKSPTTLSGIVGEVSSPSQSPVVRPVPEVKEAEIAPEIGQYHIADKYVKAVMDIIDGYYLVRKGSQARKDTTPSISQAYLTIRAFLRDEGILRDDGDYFTFTQDYRFTSASTASSVVLGRQSAGPRNWLDGENRSLGEIAGDSTR